MGLELIELVPIFMVFILYFLGMPIVYALFGSTFFYFTFIDTTSKLADLTEGYDLYTVVLDVSDSIFRYGWFRHELRRHQ